MHFRFAILERFMLLLLEFQFLAILVRKRSFESPVFFSDPDLETVERAKFIKGFTTKNGDNKKGEANALELKELGADLAEKILKFWMSNINRTLTNFQVRIAKPFLAFLPSRSKNRNADILRKFATDCQSRSIL